MVSTEAAISWVLKAGAILSALLICLGFFIGLNIVWLGVLLLILTPFMRVVIAGFCFLSQRDMLFFIIALYVILILVIGSLLKF
jgi:uncharacterized membrane protein